MESVARSIGAATCIALLLGPAGCGAGQSSPPAQTPAAAKAVTNWADTVRAFGQEFRSCGARLHPAHDFYLACMKQPRRDYRRATAAAVRALSSAGCAGSARTRVSQVSRQLDRIVFVANRALNGDYRGPPVERVANRASRIVTRDVDAVRALSRGCP